MHGADRLRQVQHVARFGLNREIEGVHRPAQPIQEDDAVGGFRLAEGLGGRQGAAVVEPGAQQGLVRGGVQGAGIQQMGVRKPWAPPRSYGLVIYLDAEFRPRASLHSRADGIHHGIVAAAEAANGDLYVLSAGAQAVLKIRSETLASLMEGNLT